MSRITIHLKSSTAAELKRWRNGVDETEAIQALIQMTLDDPSIRGKVSDYMRGPHAAHPGPASTITVALGNQTDLELSHWHPEVDAAKKIRAMIHVMLGNKYIGDQVMSRLNPNSPEFDPRRGEGPRLSGPTPF
jgi:hypothetical protein